MGDCASELIYIMNPNCGWCKKSDPVIDEYKEEGVCITKLDVSNPEDGERAKEIMQKHNIRCGTPLFVNEATGANVCGFRGKDILDKWVNGEPIPAPPPKPTQGDGMPPQRGQPQQQDPRQQQMMMAAQQQSMQQMALENQKIRYDMYKHVENRLKSKKPSHEDIVNGVEEIFSFVRKQG